MNYQTNNNKMKKNYILILINSAHQIAPEVVLYLDNKDEADNAYGQLETELLASGFERDIQECEVDNESSFVCEEGTALVNNMGKDNVQLAEGFNPDDVTCITDLAMKRCR